MTLLGVKNLTVTLATANGPMAAVRDVSFSLQRGEVLGLVGESGCGKSMTALALLGLLPEGAIAQGSIQFQSHELIGLAEEEFCRLRGNRMAMIFQEPMTSLNPLQTIGAQVAEPLILHRNFGRGPAQQEAIRLLDRVGLPDPARRFHAYPHQLSGGQRQRVMIAMALSCEPDLLLADEPTTALDVTIQRQIMDLLRGLVDEQGLSLLLISHDLGLVAEVADRILVMYGGRIVEAGAANSVFAHLAHPYTRGLFEARPRLGQGGTQRLATIPGAVPDLASIPEGCPFQNRCALAIPACAIAVPLMVEFSASHAARCIRLDQTIGFA